jgi:CDP-diacylglycerol--serine O-phosphatidyltransferase
LAIVAILTAEPFLYESVKTGLPEPTFEWVQGAQQLQLGGILIFLAGLFDLLDGLTARALKVFSPIGADLDSRADVVSFGVAPSAILYKLLWACVIGSPGYTDVDMLTTGPAFLVACFAALRLARFNVTPSKGPGFTGMPTPAVGLFVASLALVDWNNPAGWTAYLFNSKWALYGLIALLCYLMVSNIRFLKLMPSRWKPAEAWPQLLLIVVTLAAIPLLRFNAIPIAFGLYIILSLIASPKLPAAIETPNS